MSPFITKIQRDQNATPKRAYQLLGIKGTDTIRQLVWLMIDDVKFERIAVKCLSDSSHQVVQVIPTGSIGLDLALGVVGNSIKHKTHNTKGCKGNNPANDDRQRIRNVLHHLFSGFLRLHQGNAQ